MQTYEKTQWIDDWSCKLVDEPPHRLLKCFSNLSRNFGLEFHLSPVYLPTMEMTLKGLPWSTRLTGNLPENANENNPLYPPSQAIATTKP